MAIEEAASFLAVIWNRDRAELPTSAAQPHVMLIVERNRDINLSGLAGQLGSLFPRPAGCVTGSRPRACCTGSLVPAGGQ